MKKATKRHNHKTTPAPCVQKATTPAGFGAATGIRAGSIKKNMDMAKKYSDG